MRPIPCRKRNERGTQRCSVGSGGFKGQPGSQPSSGFPSEVSMKHPKNERGPIRLRGAGCDRGTNEKGERSLQEVESVSQLEGSVKQHPPKASKLRFRFHGAPAEIVLGRVRSDPLCRGELDSFADLSSVKSPISVELRSFAQVRLGVASRGTACSTVTLTLGDNIGF